MPQEPILFNSWRGSSSFITQVGLDHLCFYHVFLSQDGRSRMATVCVTISDNAQLLQLQFIQDYRYKSFIDCVFTDIDFLHRHCPYLVGRNVFLSFMYCPFTCLCFLSNQRCLHFVSTKRFLTRMK